MEQSLIRELPGMNLLADEFLRNRLRTAFPQAFVNMAYEFIIYPPVNSYFRLDNVANELELKCKVLEWCSREAHKSVNKKSKTYHFNGVNTFLETSFSDSNMEIIYQKLGNSVNRSLTIKFIESGYDTSILRGEKKLECARCGDTWIETETSIFYKCPRCRMEVFTNFELSIGR